MDVKGILGEFFSHTKENLRKLLCYLILILYFAFLIFYNSYRNTSIDITGSWISGILSAGISTIIIFFIIDSLTFLYKKYK